MMVKVTTKIPSRGDEPGKPAIPKKGAGFRPMAYLRDVRAEAMRVTWPSRRDTLVTTAAVLAMVTVTCIFFFVVDQVIGLGVRELFGVGG